MTRRSQQPGWMALGAHLVGLLLLAATLKADQEAGNRPHVATSEYGACYAKSVPAERYGSAGSTQVFRVRPEEDQLIHVYPWFSPQIYLACNVSDSKQPTGISVVRFGPWPRGRYGSADHLALAFHYKGVEVKSYSTLDIAGERENVSPSVSHYTVIKKVLGYRRVRANEYVFEVETVDGRKLAFDPVTGAQLEAGPA